MYEFLKNYGDKTCVIGSINSEGEPCGATVYYVHDENLHIYFVTRRDTDKYKNIVQNPHVSFVVTDEKNAETFQMRGVASIVSEPKEQIKLFPELMNLATERHFMPPVSQMMSSEMIFIKVEPSWARLSRFGIPHEGETFEEVKF